MEVSPHIILTSRMQQSFSLCSLGSNRYCLDKNYAGVLIIWDRMFGTFEEEKQDEKIVYGLVDQPQYFNPFKHQVSHDDHLLYCSFYHIQNTTLSITYNNKI